MSTGFDIGVKNLTKSFGAKNIINNISIDIKKSESVVILGQSGMGKSVFLNILGLLSEPNSGSLKYNNIETFKMPDLEKEKIIKKIGFLFQNCGLFSDISVIENVCFFDLFVKNNNKKIAIEKAKEILSAVKIPPECFHDSPNKISGGMQKRVAIARVLMQGPELILLDEPTSGLDPIISELLNKTINQVKNISKATIVTITHDLHSALRISDRILVLKDGNFIWDGKPTDLEKSDISYINEFIKASNVAPYNYINL